MGISDEFIQAILDENGIKEMINERWPDWNPSKHSPEALIPKLNERGKQGWELLLIQPVAGISEDHKVFFHDLATTSNVYFCVFKRRLKA